MFVRGCLYLRPGLLLLTKIGRPIVPELIETIPNKKIGPWAAVVLTQIGTPAVQPLIEALSCDDEGLSIAAAQVLGKIGQASPDVTFTLVETLNHEKAQVRQRAAFALSVSGPPAVPALVEALTAESSEVRFFAAGALGKIGDATAVPALIKALSDPNANVRSWVAMALGRMEGEGRAAVPVLILALRDPVESVHQSAVAALKRIATPQALKAVSQFQRQHQVGGNGGFWR